MTAAARPEDLETLEIVDALESTLRRFCAEEIDSAVIDREGAIPRRLLDALAELGMFGLALPEAWGGAGLPMWATCRLVAVLAGFDRSVATTVGLHLGLGTRGLVRYGTEEQKARWLPELARGARIAAFAATEPGAGSDLTAIRTTAKADGGALVIDGTKIYVTNARLARLVTLAVSAPDLGGGRRGQHLVVVDPASKGVSVGREERKLGLRGSSTASIVFEGVRVPLDHAIPLPPTETTLVEPVLAFGRTVMAAGCVGAAQAALDRTMQHVTSREQFGRPLFDLEVVGRQLAELAALHFAMTALVDRASRAVDEPDAFLRRSMAAKILASEGASEIADRGIQLHGGFGFIEESGAPLFLRDARVTRIFEGANDVLATRLGTAELATKGAVSEDSPLPRRVLREKAAALGTRYGVRAFGKQAELHRLGRLAVLAESVEAARAHADALGTPEAEALSNHWAAIAEERARPWAAELAPKERVDVITRALHARTVR